MLLPISYFPPVSWFKLLIYGGARIDAGEDYVKQTLRNRCHIATAAGVQRLTVPVVKARKTADVMIAPHGNWQQKHWHAICTAYGESAFLDYYEDDLRPFFTPEFLDSHRSLLDFDMAIIQKMLALMEIEYSAECRVQSAEFAESAECRVQSAECHRAAKLCTLHSALCTEFKPYYQVFREKTGFLPDLSILDLLLNLGPEAAIYLRDL